MGLSARGETQRWLVGRKAVILDGKGNLAIKTYKEGSKYVDR